MIGFEAVIFGIGLFLLVWGSSLFVESAVALANFFHLPEILIGATIVSLGTTLPEMLFSTIASIKGLPEMALGNVLGSILCNTGLIAGFMISLKPIYLKTNAVKHLLLSSIFLCSGFMVYLISGISAGGLTRLSGITLLFLCLLYVGYTTGNHRETSSSQPVQKFGTSQVIRMLLESISIYFGANLLVQHGPKLARYLGVPEMIISLTLVAFGTSLPEFVTSLVAIKKKHSSLSLGNIIGANVLNFLIVGGISALICPISFPKNVLTLELPFVFFLLFTLCLPSIIRKKAVRFQGLLLLAGYSIYLFLITHKVG